MAIKDELLDELLADYKNPEDLLGRDGVFQELKKRLLERALGAELTHHLGYEKGDRTARHGAPPHDERDDCVPAATRHPAGPYEAGEEEGG